MTTITIGASNRIGFITDAIFRISSGVVGSIFSFIYLLIAGMTFTLRIRSRFPQVP